jgi:hypothetical protein
MPADVPVLAPERTASLIDGFLTRILPDREPAADECEVPQYADRPHAVSTDAADLIRLRAARPDLERAVYRRHRDPAGEPRAAHVFFPADGGLVLGLSTARPDPEPSRLLANM